MALATRLPSNTAVRPSRIDVPDAVCGLRTADPRSCRASAS